MQELAKEVLGTLIDPKQLPSHVAFIMDGNRRWAQNKGVSPTTGHCKGAEVLTQMVEVASSLGIKIITAYAFSTENWKRSEKEVEFLLALFHSYLMQQKEAMLRKGVRLNVIGNIDAFPSPLKNLIQEVCESTKKNSKIDLVLAMNYGARDDITRAFIQIAQKCLKGEVLLEQITEQFIARHLDTGPWGDPDLLIRTSGEKRLSNFLLWQLAYTEIYLTDRMWPDFDEEEFVKALIDFQKRNRRKGQ